MAVFYEVQTENGKEKLTLNLGALYELSRKDKPVADRYHTLYKKMQRKEAFTEFEIAEVLYIAYRCAHVKEEEHMELEEFLYVLTDNRVEIMEAFGNVFGAREKEKKQGFQKHSGKRPRR